MNNGDDADLENPVRVSFREILFRLVFGNEVEWGDSVFYTCLTLVLLALLWLMTIEKWFGISVWACLIPWGVVVWLIWKAYFRQNRGG